MVKSIPVQLSFVTSGRTGLHCLSVFIHGITSSLSLPQFDDDFKNCTVESDLKEVNMIVLALETGMVMLLVRR